MDSTSRPTYPTSVNLEASTLMNGEPESRAKRRAISVFPTPVGPIMMMFLGATSSAISGGSFSLRIRLRSAMATARLAACWPITSLSSSTTIWRGVSGSKDWLVPAVSGRRKAIILSLSPLTSDLFEHDLIVGINADTGGDLHRPLRYLSSGQRRVRHQSPRCGEGVGPSRTDGNDPVVRLDEIAVSGEQEDMPRVGNDEHRIQTPEHPVGTPVLGQLHRGSLQITPILLKLAFEFREERLGVGGGPGETGENLTVGKTSQFLGALLEDRVTTSNSPIRGERGPVIPPDGEHRGSVTPRPLGPPDHGQSILNGSDRRQSPGHFLSCRAAVASALPEIPSTTPSLLSLHNGREW